MYFETLKGFYCSLLFCHDSYTVYFRLVMFIRSGGKARFLKEQMIMRYYTPNNLFTSVAPLREGVTKVKSSRGHFDLMSSSGFHHLPASPWLCGCEGRLIASCVLRRLMIVMRRYCRRMDACAFCPHHPSHSPSLFSSHVVYLTPAPLPSTYSGRVCRLKVVLS